MYSVLHDKRAERNLFEIEATDILSKLMEANEFSDEELVDQLLTLIAAAHKTTSLTFTWLIYLLALYPKMQSRLREEISTGVPQYSYDDADQDLVALLESLPLLNGIYNETLRSFPTVPLSMRAPNKDTVVVGQHIPKGTEIYIIPWATNRCRDRWGQDAHEFRPERWIDATTGNPNNSGGASSNYAIMTFLQGVYMCIGQGFAKAELRALTCHICPCL